MPDRSRWLVGGTEVVSDQAIVAGCTVGQAGAEMLRRGANAVAVAVAAAFALGVVDGTSRLRRAFRPEPFGLRDPVPDDSLATVGIDATHVPVGAACNRFSIRSPCLPDRRLRRWWYRGRVERLACRRLGSPRPAACAAGVSQRRD